MEKFQELRDSARKKIQIADHMLSVTYPLLQEPKLLLSALEGTFLAYTYAMGSVLHYERLFHKIPPFQDNFESKFNMFKSKVIDKYQLDHQYLQDMQDLKIMLMEHKQSPVEFGKKDKFVICSDSFKVKTVSVKDMQRYINRCSLFIQDISSITAKNEGLFR